MDCYLPSVDKRAGVHAPLQEKPRIEVDDDDSKEDGIAIGRGQECMESTTVWSLHAWKYVSAYKYIISNGILL
jgi:hypothetical protein